MPRASRYLREGYTCHLTHRCHDRRFLLRFARDRDVCREWLRVASQRYKVPVYGYSITCNHIHVVVHVDNCERVGLMMHLVAGATAQQWNRRKEHEASVWEHPYQCTIIQNGQHLLNCLRYVDLNMVRAGRVPHPSEWRWCGFDELTGLRSRYRIIAIDRLLESLDFSSLEDFRKTYADGIAEQIARDDMRRRPEWTQVLAFGDRSFVEQITSGWPNRRRFSYVKSEALNAWAVHEPETPYSPVV